MDERERQAFSSAYACGGHPVQAMSSTSAPPCRTSKRSRSKPLSLHRIGHRRSMHRQCRRQRGRPSASTPCNAVITNGHQAIRSLDQRIFQRHRSLSVEFNVSKSRPLTLDGLNRSRGRVLRQGGRPVQQGIGRSAIRMAMKYASKSL
jgi:hypothetical protein